MNGPVPTVLAVSAGDPAGIAGEITAAAWSDLRHDGPVFAVYGDPDWLASHGVPVQVVATPDAARTVFHAAMPVIPVRLASAVRPGKPDGNNAAATIESIVRATSAVLAGEAAALVTNPISKAVLARAGFAHPGHTEFLAALCGAPDDAVMMLASPQLRVVPVTIHVSLRHAIAELTTAAILRVARITAHALARDWGIAAPRLAIAGLNPHAGEEGRMGEEEGTIIRPAIATLRAEGIDATGPTPPDTLFTETRRPSYDVAICMYHDQALIPLKTLDMNEGVNVTLGLPIVRTSPDHGTAFDIAGQGRADPRSLRAALRLADLLARRRRQVAARA